MKGRGPFVECYICSDTTSTMSLEKQSFTSEGRLFGNETLQSLCHSTTCIEYLYSDLCNGNTSKAVLCRDYRRSVSSLILRLVYVYGS